MAAACWPAGFTVTLWNVVTVSLRQQIVPADLLGRVNSVYRMLGWGLMPLGALAGGFVAHAGGLRAPYVGGIVCALALAAASRSCSGPVQVNPNRAGKARPRSDA